jgi:hypothetical protein
MEGSMSKKHELTHIKDFLKLTPEEFARMLPDLVAWYGFSKEIESVEGSEISGRLLWYDDGKPGEIHSVVLREKGTGRTEVLRGSAYTETP